MNEYNKENKVQIKAKEIVDLVEGVPTYGGHHLEKIASYGDPTCVSFPIPQVQSTNLSFVGLETFCRL